ncbi:MAG: PQ-loop repeat-containing protein [bacterium]
MFYNSFLTDFIVWVVNISFVFAVMPQIYLNYKEKTTRGLSDLYLVGYFNGYAINFLYVFSLNFNLAYKVRAIAAVFAVGYMLWQRFSYDSDFLNLKIKSLYLADFLLIFLAGLLIFMDPFKGGHIAGWALVGIWTFYQLPQVIKIYKSKSVAGFSFVLVSLIGIGNTVELIMSFILKLPIQTHLIALRGIIIYLIFITQFITYGKKQKFVVQKIKQNIK